MGKKRQDNTGQQFPTFTTNLGIIILLPLLIFFIMGSPMTLEYPVLKGFNFKGGMVIRPEFIYINNFKIFFFKQCQII